MYRHRRDFTDFLLSARRIHLEDVIADADLVRPVRRLAANGLDAWAQVGANGYEGLISKDEARSYEGRASSPAVDKKLKRRRGPLWSQCPVKAPRPADEARRPHGQFRKQGIEDVGRGQRYVIMADGRVRSSGGEATGIVQALKGGGDAEATYRTVPLRPSEGHHD